MAEPVPFPSATLRALLDRLIPSDDCPGALDAGVEHYVMRQLSGDCAHEADSLRAGLLRLDDESDAQHGGLRFAALSSDQQDALLREIEKGQVVIAWPRECPPAAFFERMVDLAHEGFYADPGNGGNRDGVSWRMVGYDPRLPRATEPLLAPEASAVPRENPPLSPQ